MKFEIEPIGVVHSNRTEAVDDDWDLVPASIEFNDDVAADALDGIETFSHAEILYVFDRVHGEKIERGARHPRGNTAWPRVGILAQRGKNRPNRLGATIVRVLGREGRTLHVAGLDAIDGTPVIDLKPVMREFLPRGEVRQPAWATELMRDYWRRDDSVRAATMRVALVTLLVRDYDEAIAYYTRTLGFELLEDTKIDGEKRWVRVAPPSGSGAELLLARATNETQTSCVGNQVGGRVFLFLRVEDFDRRYGEMKSRGVRFVETPRRETYGSVAVFEDLYGNRWDLVSG